MKEIRNTLLVIYLTAISLVSHTQENSIIGFWGVEKVVVGEEIMTPVAKWFRIKSDSSIQSGNGWLQNGGGSWSYDEGRQLFTPHDPLGMANEFGGFAVSFDGDQMLWEREEEGMLVKVSLKPIEQLPMSPADYLKGVWDLEEITADGVSILAEFDEANQHKFFFRWDRVYINRRSDGSRSRGVWHIHGHRSEITLLSNQEDREAERWQIEVNEKELVMNGLSKSNQHIRRKYLRKNTF